MILSRSLGAAGLALALVGSASAQQQGVGSDYSGPGGNGAGAGGSYAPLGLPGAGVPSSPLSSAGTSALGNILNLFGSSGGVSVSAPGGGQVTVSAQVGQALAAVLSGNANGSTSVLSQAFVAGGVSEASAGALSTALGALGASPNLATLTRAIAAFNAAIDAIAGQGGSVPPALVAVRFALASMSR